jgi:hypothetical protein
VHLHLFEPVLVDSYEGLNRVVSVFENVNAGETPRVIVDLAAQTAAPLAHWIKDSDLLSLLADMGARIVTLAQLHEASMRKIDRQNASFWAAIHHRSEDDALGLLASQRVKNWLRKSYESFDSLPI